MQSRFAYMLILLLRISRTDKINKTTAINTSAIPFSETRIGVLMSVVLNNNNTLSANKATPANSRFSAILAGIKNSLL